MNKKEFFDELNEYLIGIKKEDKEEILQDYEEHFKIGKKKKRSESDIVASLGAPKQIAREIRKELSPSDKEELKSEAIETWVAAKKLSIHLFHEAKRKIEHIPKTRKGKKKMKKHSTLILFVLIAGAVLLIFNSPFLLIATLLFLCYLAFGHGRSSSRKHKGDKAAHRKEKGNSLFRIFVLVAFNALFFIWIWVSLLFVIASFLISGLVLTASSIFVILFMVFALVNYMNPLTKDILFSGLFAGLGVGILGVLLTSLCVRIIKLFLKMTKKYIELNGRFIRK